MIYLYREPEPDEFLLIGADPAEGNDNSCFVALSKKYGDVVMVGQSKEESSSLGHTLNHIATWIYNQTDVYPMIAVERNVGSATLYVLKTLHYKNLYRMPQSFTKIDQEQSDDYGWITSSSTRPKMLDDLSLAIRQGSITIPSKPIVDELFTFIRHKKTGKPQADSGCHDDLVMALAIAWQLYQTESTPLSRSNVAEVMNRNSQIISKWSI